MKLFLSLFFLALGADIACPGRCWEEVNGVCAPENGKVVVDCSVVGHVSLSIDPCVFSLGESDFPELYTVFPNATMSHSTDPTCFRKIETTTTSLEWSWTYAEAADCGWEWSQSDTQISFSSVLRAALTVDFQGQDLTVAKFPEEISVPCNFNSIMSITAEITAEESTVTTQKAEASGNMTLATGFSVSLVDDANVAKTSFTVGETIEAKFVFDNNEAGHTASDMPFGFFANKCYVQSQANTAHVLYLVGSSDASVREQCNMDAEMFDLHVSNSVETVPYWSSEEYAIKFDTFQFGRVANSMSITCDLELCLTDDCPNVATQANCTGIDYAGYDTRFVENVSTLEDCMDLCIEDVACNAIAFEPNDSHVCWIKHDAGDYYIKSITTSALKCNFVPKVKHGLPDGIYNL